MSLRILVLKDTLTAKAGATKLTLDIVRSFVSCGDEVHVVFFRDDGTFPLANGKDMPDHTVTIFKSGLKFKLSQAIQTPLIKLFLRDAFLIKDAINIFDQILFARKINKSKEDFDIIISMSIWSGVASIFLKPTLRKRQILYFHEPPTFSGLPYAVRKVLNFYLSELLKRTEFYVSITDKMRDAIKSDLGVNTYVVKDYFTIKPTVSEKGDYVLLDTRWTFVRNPFFVIDIMKLLKDTRFVMCGSFGSTELRARFIEKLGNEGMTDRISIKEGISESALDEIYSRAKCYIRWSNPKIIETGPSYGLIQAISNGCVPIVSHDIGSASDVTENIGVDFAVSNTPEGFASAIIKLFNDKNFFDDAVSRVIKWRNSYTLTEYRQVIINMLESKTIP